MPVALTGEERAIAAGAHGEAKSLAMRLVSRTGTLLGADRLIPIASAHIDGCLYLGDGGTEYAERLVAGAGRVAVPTTLNVGALDLLHPDRVNFDPHRRAMALRTMRAYQALGCAPTFTCAPYQAGHRPAQGTDVAWGESNAVAFCNSVLGARTNRYGDFIDIACAIAGRAPHAGLHKAEARRATLVLDASHLPARILSEDAAWPVLGTILGRRAGERIGAFIGLGPYATEDRLKALGAAAAAWGAVALFHIVGVTPEAPTLAAATGGQDASMVTLTAGDLREALDLLSTVDANPTAVAIGSPHASLAELDALIARFAGRATRLPFYVNTGRHIVEALSEAQAAALEGTGVTLVTDTCIVVAPILPEREGVLLTNSAKFANYAPANLSYGVVYGTLGDCVESAVAGRLVREAALWA